MVVGRWHKNSNLLDMNKINIKNFILSLMLSLFGFSLLPYFMKAELNDRDARITAIRAEAASRSLAITEK